MPETLTGIAEHYLGGVIDSIPDLPGGQFMVQPGK